MSSTRTSPRKNQGMRPERYGRAVDDSERDTTVSPRGKQASKGKLRPIGKQASKGKLHPIGYKRTPKRTPPRKESSDSSSESSVYKDDSEEHSEDDGPTVIDVSKKKKKMPSRIHRGRSGERRSKGGDNDTEPSRSNRRRIDDEIHEDNESNDEYAENNRRGERVTADMRSGIDVRKRMFVDEGLTKRIVVNENEYDDEEEQEDEDSDDGRTLLSENRKKDLLIATLTRKIKDLERTVHEMSSVTRTDNRDKTEWTGEEMNFVKDVNDFCKEKLYPKEKFLRKNWQLYLPNDRNSLCWVVMKNLSIPERSDPMDIWKRVIVPTIRDKYLSMRCNMTTKIKGIYQSMKN
jgi:hypothetical protein